MVLGLDIGSCYTKGILYNGKIIKTAVTRTLFKPRQAIEKIKEELAGYKKICSTGYGRELVTDAHKKITEITAFAYGASYLDLNIKTIIDIGGQDSKIIKLRNNKVDRFVMNDRCAAGTGNFIEKIAQSLGLSLDEFAAHALRSERHEPIDSLCVVMAETEILSLVSEGKPIEDIVAGVCDSLCRRLIGIASQVGIETPILFCGGGALNPGIVKAMQRLVGKVIVPDHPQFIGALGAAAAVSNIDNI